MVFFFNKGPESFLPGDAFTPCHVFTTFRSIYSLNDALGNKISTTPGTGTYAIANAIWNGKLALYTNNAWHYFPDNAVTATSFGILTNVSHTVAYNTIYKVGNICFGRCRIVANGTYDWPAQANIFNAPSGYRPPYTIGLNGMLFVTGTGLVPVVTTIASDGTVALTYSSNSRTTQWTVDGVWFVQ